jgi:CxxC motif-containing protein (DUF1111 family)
VSWAAGVTCTVAAILAASANVAGGEPAASAERASILIDAPTVASENADAGWNVAAARGKDPGPRAGAASAGGFFPLLNGDERAFFAAARARFVTIDSVSGAVGGEPGGGLGPRFNGNSCSMCHAQPAVGGTSPGPNSPQKPTPNPLVALATLDGAKNTLPAFVTAAGPVREARFKSDGNVHDLFTIAGRTDAPGCSLAQPDFAAALRNDDVSLRIPTPLFGLGLVEATPDATLQANLTANATANARLGIGGVLNAAAEDGTISRFGWKAQTKSLQLFAGQAYNVEQGVSNELFPNERSAVDGCVFNASPEDTTRIVDDGDEPGAVSDVSADTLNFAAFMRLSAPPAPANLTSAAQSGQTLFASIGCASCHTATLTTGRSQLTGMSHLAFHPYSDFALHHMGSNLADGIRQGAAGPDQFRTAPLWGIGQRLYFLHDGRTSDLAQAIEAHASPGASCVGGAGANEAVATDSIVQLGVSQKCASEANAVIRAFNALSTSQQTEMLEFLRSL